MVAPWSANGAQTSVLAPSAAEEKSRSRTAVSSSATLLRVVQRGSGMAFAESGPTARFTNSRAIAEANSLAVSAASAGQKNAMDVNGRLSLVMTDTSRYLNSTLSTAGLELAQSKHKYAPYGLITIMMP